QWNNSRAHLGCLPLPTQGSRGPISLPRTIRRATFKKSFCGTCGTPPLAWVDICLLDASPNRCVPVRRKDRRRSLSLAPHTPVPPAVPFAHASTNRSVVFQGDVQLSEKRK